MRKFDEKGKPAIFSLECISADHRYLPGGRVLRFEEARLSGHKPKSKIARHAEKLRAIQAKKKDPDHRANSTVNVYDLRRKCTRKIHVRLITRLNGETVIY